MNLYHEVIHSLSASFAHKARFIGNRRKGEVESFLERYITEWSLTTNVVLSVYI